MSALDDSARRRESDPNGEPPHVLALFLEHRDLAQRLTHRFQRSGHRADLGQVADIALLLAARRYQPERGAFERFAIVTITGELKKHLRKVAWNAHVPRRVQEDALAVQGAIDRLAVELGRSPLLSEVREATHLSAERVSQAIRAHSARYVATELDDDRLDRSAGADDPSEYLDLRAAVADLPSGDRELVLLVFEDDLTQREVASRVGISQSQVQRRLARALESLHGRLTHPDAVQSMSAS